VYIEDYFLQQTKRVGSRRPLKALPAHEREKVLPAAVSVDQLTGGSSYNPDKAEYEVRGEERTRVSKCLKFSVYSTNPCKWIR
jgi:hypothetical protein